MKKRFVTSLLLFCAYALAQAPGAVAIHNAKIVPVSGPVIAKGTVVLRNGLIEQVGENVQAPADAWVVDAEGMTVYPGLIDGLSTVGIPGAASRGSRARRARRSYTGDSGGRGPGGSRRARLGTGGPAANHQLAAGGGRTPGQ